MRTSFKPIPGTLAIVLQFALLTGVLCGLAAGFCKRRPPAMPSLIAVVPTPPMPANDANQKQTITLYSVRFESPGQKYRVETEDFESHNEPGDWHANLRLFNNETNETLWESTVAYASGADVSWSEDGRNAMIFDDRSRLWIWREGERVRELRRFKFLDSEGVMDLHWSPNKQALLIRTAPSQGSYTPDLGYLWYVHLPSGQERLLLDGSVRSMEWLSNHKIRFKTVEFLLSPTGTYLGERIQTHERTLR